MFQKIKIWFITRILSKTAVYITDTDGNIKKCYAGVKTKGNYVNIKPLTKWRKQ